MIVIGSGAGGGTLAYRLAPAGKRVLLLERGGYLPRERDNWDSAAVFVKAKYPAPEFWYDKHGDEFPPGSTTTSAQHYVLRDGVVSAAAGELRGSAAPRRGVPGLGSATCTRRRWWRPTAPFSWVDALARSGRLEDHRGRAGRGGQSDGHRPAIAAGRRAVRSASDRRTSAWMGPAPARPRREGAGPFSVGSSGRALVPGLAQLAAVRDQGEHDDDVHGDDQQ